MIEGLRTSRMGRAMLAVKDNEIEAQAIGINVYKTKLAAFTLSGMVAGVGGAFLALLLTSVTPTAFQSPSAEATSILLLTLVAIGGIDRAFGRLLRRVSLGRSAAGVRRSRMLLLVLRDLLRPSC